MPGRDPYETLIGLFVSRTSREIHSKAHLEDLEDHLGAHLPHLEPSFASPSTSVAILGLGPS